MGIKISSLPIATLPYSGNEQFPLVQSGVTKNGTLSSLVGYITLSASSLGGNTTSDAGKLARYDSDGRLVGSSNYRGGVFGLAVGSMEFGSVPIGVIGQANAGGVGGLFYTESGVDHVIFGNPLNTTDQPVTIARDQGAIKWIRGNANQFSARILPTNSITANRVYTLPDTSGMIALIAPDVAIGGATTLTTADYDKTFVCAGSTDYVIQLPSGSDIGKLIHFRMARQPALAGFVTIRAASGQTIDGQQDRVMWALETATLRATGSGWSKISGRSLPLKGKATNISGDGGGYVQSIPNNDPTAVVNLVEIEFDNSGRMVDITDPNDRINIRRKGTYSIHGCIYWNGAAAWTASRVFGRIHKNGSIGIAFSESNAQAGTYPVNNPSTSVELNTGDFLQLIAYQNSGAPRPLENSALCSLSVVEIPDW